MRYQEIELGRSVSARRARDSRRCRRSIRCRRSATTSTAAPAAWCFPATPARTTSSGTSSTASRNLKYLIVETAFSNKERQLAEMSKHLCPSMLAEELAKLELDPEVWITHLKPGEIELTMQEIEECAGRHRPRMLQNNQVFEF